ncbi:MAG TPA: hypothetical protein VFM96_09845 [Gaiellaceae bacterium]|nr:hypothetical protein [Gaiellaceae bacterium]
MRAARLLEQAGEIAGEVADLLLAEDEPSTFFGFPVSVAWSTSMIAKCVFGNDFAAVAIALAWSKPTEMTSAAPFCAARARFGMYDWLEAAW